MPTTETVYKNRDNPNSVLFYEDQVAMDFTAVTRMVLTLYNSNNVVQATYDSASSPTPITWTGNTVTFKLHDTALSAELYFAKLVAFDPTRPVNGQVLAHPLAKVDQLNFRIVNA